MSVIKVTLPPGELPVNGKQVSFKAPCDCSVAEAIQIEGVNYTVVDNMDRCVTGDGGMWTVGSIVTVVLDVDNQKAYFQNNIGGKVATGSYVGTGTSGSGNPNSLQFEFTPKLVVISTTAGYPARPGIGIIHVPDNNGFYSDNKNMPSNMGVSFVGGCVTWYNSSALTQMNESDMTYNYTAFG